MNSDHHKRPHIVFYFSDTGGGHRSAAEAIIEAMELDYGGRFTSEMVDFYKEYGPGLLKRMPWTGALFLFGQGTLLPAIFGG